MMPCSLVFTHLKVSVSLTGITLVNSFFILKFSHNKSTNTMNARCNFRAIFMQRKTGSIAVLPVFPERSLQNKDKNTSSSYKCLKTIDCPLYTIAFIRLTDTSNSSARGSKHTPSISLRFSILLSLSE